MHLFLIVLGLLAVADFLTQILPAPAFPQRVLGILVDVGVIAACVVLWHH